MLYCINVFAYSTFHGFAQLSKMAQELRFEALIQSQHVVENQYLSVGDITRSDTDSRAGYGLGYFFCQCRRNLLKHDGKAASLIQEFSVA